MPEVAVHSQALGHLHVLTAVQLTGNLEMTMQ